MCYHINKTNERQKGLLDAFLILDFYMIVQTSDGFIG